MANRPVNLPVPAVIDAGNGLIIGQLTLLYSKILFGVAISLTAGTEILRIPGAWLVLTLVLAVPAVMLINLLVGWIATRNTFNEFEHYPNSLFSLDVLMIVVSFILVNFISFSMLPAANFDCLSAMLFASGFPQNASPSQVGILELNTVRILPPFVYGLSGILLFLMLKWNKAYVKEKNRIKGKDVVSDGFTETNEIIYICLPAHFFLVFASYVFDSVVVEIACVTIWSMIWMWLNVKWVLSAPMTTAVD